MVIAIIINSILFLILTVLVAVKTIHFKKYISSKRRTLANWLYFNHDTVIKSSSKKSIANKQKQNTYSVRIGVVLIIIVCALAVEVVLLDQPLPGMMKSSERPAAPTIKR